MLAVLVFNLFASCYAFNKMPVRRLSATSLKSMNDFSITLAELYASPTARYNGELIDKSLKLVEKVPKEGVAFGEVSSDSYLYLVIALITSVALAAAVPYFLAIGETALKQQREREDTNRIGDNQFAAKAREAKATVAQPLVGPKRQGNKKF